MVIGSEVVGLVVLLVLVFLTGEPLPQVQNLLMAAVAGAAGGFGLILLYRALAGGQMSVAAPISAVLAAAIPVLVSIIWLGWPDPLVLAGLLLALLAIWMIAGGEWGRHTGAPAPGANPPASAGRGHLWLVLCLAAPGQPGFALLADHRHPPGLDHLPGRFCQPRPASPSCRSAACGR